MSVARGLLWPAAVRHPARIVAVAPTLALLLASGGLARAVAPAPLAPPARGAVARLRSFAQRVRAVLTHPPLAPARLEPLVRAARDPARAHLRWTPGRPLAEADSAHLTNTPAQLSTALEGAYNFLEGDTFLQWGVRRLPGTGRLRSPVMGHDLGSTDGLRTSEWLRVGAASGRGLKLDIKQAAAIPHLIAEVRRHGLDERGLIFNADVVIGPGGPSRTKLGLANLVQHRTASLKDLRRLRRAFPGATIALGAYTGGGEPAPAGSRYTPAQLDFLARYARDLSGPVFFPLRAELVDADVVARLKPFGQVAIWNDPATYVPPRGDAAADAARFRAMGVDGMIDLRVSAE